MKIALQVVSTHWVLCPENMGVNSPDWTGATDGFSAQVWQNGWCPAPVYTLVFLPHCFITVRCCKMPTREADARWRDYCQWSRCTQHQGIGLRFRFSEAGLRFRFSCEGLTHRCCTAKLGEEESKILTLSKAPFAWQPGKYRSPKSERHVSFRECRHSWWGLCWSKKPLATRCSADCSALQSRAGWKTCVKKQQLVCKDKVVVQKESCCFLSSFCDSSVVIHVHHYSHHNTVFSEGFDFFFSYFSSPKFKLLLWNLHLTFKKQAEFSVCDLEGWRLNG